MIPIYTRRRMTNILHLTFSVLAMIFGLSWLFWILFVLIGKGLDGISVALFTEMTPAPGSAGGLLNAIIGSLMMVTLATLIGTPVGILAGTYLAEFGQRGWLASVTRFINDILLSAPSIVIGLFVYTVYVAKVGHFSGWAGALALNNQFWTVDMNQPMANLPVVIFQFAMSPYESWQELAWAGALLITLSVLGLNIIARFFLRKKTLSA